jgi:selenocysteine lyase/cysteine desulfurase
VIITLHEHVGGCAAWLYRAKTEGIVLKLAALGATAEETLNNIKSVKTKNTKVIAVPHIPCTIGQVLPVNEICAWAKANGIISAIDGAHPLGMLQMNLKEMGCDYYSGCFHKWLLGPIGTGFFYASEEILSRSVIHHVAAYSVDKFDMSSTPPSMGELVNKTARYSYGTFPGPMYDGAKAAMQFYQKIGPALIEKRVKYLSKEVMNGLMEINDNPSLKFPVIEVLTPSEDASRGAQVGFRIHEHPSKIASSNAQGTKEGTPTAIKAMSQSLAPGTSTPQASQRFCDFARKNNVILRYVAENNIHCVRVSTHYYNNKKDINRFFEVLQMFLKDEGWM